MLPKTDDTEEEVGSNRLFVEASTAEFKKFQIAAQTNILVHISVILVCASFANASEQFREEMQTKFDFYENLLYISIGLLVVIYCLMGFFRHLLMVWIALWTVIISFTYTCCDVVPAHTFSVNMISSQLAILICFSILPSPKPKPDSDICDIRFIVRHGIVIVAFNLIFAIAEYMIVSYLNTEDQDVPLFRAGFVALYSVLQIGAIYEVPDGS